MLNAGGLGVWPLRRLGVWLLQKYQQSHGVRTDRALYDYVQALKQEDLRSGQALSKVAFYQLCSHLEPQYHQLEFEVRVYLTHLEATGEKLWTSV